MSCLVVVSVGMSLSWLLIVAQKVISMLSEISVGNNIPGYHILRKNIYRPSELKQGSNEDACAKDDEISTGQEILI